MAIPHEIPLIATVSVSLGLAFIAGFAAMRLGLPPLLGYLLAGVLVGPFTPGFVADADIAKELAEIGVILLMFGVGTHFSVRDLWAVRRVALPGAIVQIGVATALGAWLASAWGWPLGGALVFGLSLSVASTVVMLKALQARGLVDSVNGRIAVGWLVVEDLAMVLALVLLPALAGFLGDAPAEPTSQTAGLGATVAITFLKIGLFFGLMYVIGLRLFPWLSRELTRAGSGELATLFVAAVAISLAYGAATAFSVSFALGAFLAGVIINEAGLTARVSQQVEVLEHVFAALFFVSVGMLVNPHILVEEPLRVLAVLAIIMIGKSLAALGIVLLFRHPLNTALTVSASLAQIGEFSFILAGLGVGLGLLPAEGRDLILAGAILSIALNPLAFHLASRLGAWVTKVREPQVLALEPGADGTLQAHVVIVGYGRVGRMIVRDLSREKIPLLVVEERRDIGERLRKRGIPVVAGDAATAELLKQAQLEQARLAIIAIPNVSEARRIFDLIKVINPQLGIVVRVHAEEDAEYFREHGAERVLMAEHELAHSMSRHVMHV